MSHYSASNTLNGAATYDSSLMNPFAFTDAELLLHVTPGNGYSQPDGFQHQTAAGQHGPLSGLFAESNSGGISGLASLLDNGEATSVARPLPEPVNPSEAISRSTCCQSPPPRLTSGTFQRDVFRSQNFSDTQLPELEHADSVLEDPLDHREKNRVAQKKFRARQKEKMRTTQNQLDQLTRQVSMLLSEKSQLETRTRILEQVVYLNTNHEQMLHANEVRGRHMHSRSACAAVLVWPAARDESRSHAFTCHCPSCGLAHHKAGSSTRPLTDSSLSN